MKKRFNVTGVCVPEKHYMTDLTDRISQIKEMVDFGDYFTINCARQYGKTTTLTALAKALKNEYLVISLDFQRLGSASFQNENVFSLAFLQIFLRELERQRIEEDSGMDEIIKEMRRSSEAGKNEKFNLLPLFEQLASVCSCSVKPVVLLIDEVDSAADNQVFLDFLAQLRACYMERDSKGTITFQSVILASVYDVKNLKRKLRPDEEHKMNSPWNIAADFDVNMSLTKGGIEGMLEEYEADHCTGMNVEEIAGLLCEYTSGYPYLVSRLCKLMDEKIRFLDKTGNRESAWTKKGFLEAVRILLSEDNTLFDSLTVKLADYPELNRMLRELLFFGKEISCNLASQAIQLAFMFGFVKKEDGKVVPANRIFDTFLYNHFLSDDELHDSDIYKASLTDRNQFLAGGHLNMRRILEKFTEHFHDLYGNSKESFVEEEGRRYFLLYLRPIINGTGNYYIESRTRSLGRTDLIVDYRGEQFVVEMKIWHGNEYNTRGESQLAGYLEDYHLSVGYMISFNFNKNKRIGVHEVMFGDKKLIEAVV